MLANGVKETTTTTGTGTITLSAVTGSVRFAQAFSEGALVSYAIKDGNNWEWGLGNVGASNTLARSNITATLSAGTYTADGTATALSLSGSAEVICCESAHTPWQSGQMLHDIRNGADNGNRIYLGVLSVSSFSTAGLSSGRAVALPFVLDRTTKIVSLSCEVTTALAGDTVDVAIRAKSPDNDYPGAIIWSAVGDSAFATDAIGVLTKTIDLILPPGLYWICSYTPTAVRTYNAHIQTQLPQTAFAGTLGAPLRTNNNTNNVGDPALSFYKKAGDATNNPVWQAVVEVM